jgi:hypothetical protein
MGEHKREKSIRGRRTGGGGSAGGGTGTGRTGGGSAGGSSLTGVAGGTKSEEDTIREEGISNGGGGPLHTDTVGAKVTEGPRASKTRAGGESPGEDE